jgi:hypothetical protein
VTLKTSLNKVDTDKKKLETDLAALNAKFGKLAEDEGFSVDEWERLKSGNKDTPEAIQTLKEQHAAAVKKIKEDHAKELADKDSAITERDTYIDRTLIDNGLKDSLLDVGVNPDLLEGAVASLKGKVRVEKNSDGTRVALVDSDIGPVGVTEFVKDWSTTTGKPYIGKPSGSEAPGARRKGKAPGDFGGDHSSRVDAIKNKFPELS